MDSITSQRFKLFRPGPVSLLGLLIRVTRPDADHRRAVHAQHVQRGRLPARLDNDRYGARTWTTARDVLAAHHVK